MVLRSAPLSGDSYGSGASTHPHGRSDPGARLFGIGCAQIWIGHMLGRSAGAMLADPSLKETVGIPMDYPFHFPMMIGYAKVNYYRLPERRAPKIHWQ